MPQDDTLHAGMLIGGRCRLEEEIGHGRMGIVWRARDEQDGTSCALKFLTKDFAADQVAVADLIEEIHICQKLDHASIIRTHRLLKDREHRLVAVQMELVTGGSLADRRVDRPFRRFEVAEIKLWVLQLCEALGYAHHADVIHRDLKPSNLLLDAGNSLKLADFGIARVFN